MASVNRVILLGRLGRAPKTSDAQGLAICRLALATTRRYKGRDGEKKEETEWHNVLRKKTDTRHCFTSTEKEKGEIHGLQL